MPDAAELFRQTVQRNVPRHYHVGTGIDLQVCGGNAAALQTVQLRDKVLRVENNAGADEAERVGIENTGRDQVQLVHLAVVDHGVAGVVAAGGTDNDIRTGCHNVNDFSFSLVAPLGTDYNICRHKNSSLFQTSKFRMQRTLQHTFLL